MPFEKSKVVEDGQIIGEDPFTLVTWIILDESDKCELPSTFNSSRVIIEIER